MDIAKKTNLSRPAVSHHMQILKDAGIVKVRKEGTYVYYFLDQDEKEVEKIADLFLNIQRIMKNVPVQPFGFTVTESALFKVCLRQRGRTPVCSTLSAVICAANAQMQAELLLKSTKKLIYILTPCQNGSMIYKTDTVSE